MVALESRPMDACPIVCGRLSRRCQGMKKKDQGDADLAVGKPLSAASIRYGRLAPTDAVESATSGNDQIVVVPPT